MPVTNLWLAEPNMPDGSWAGTRSFAYMPRPPGGQAVVYYLYDGANLVYIGSTDRFEERISVHKNYRRGKQFTHWRASPAGDRCTAYRVERAEIHRLHPHLNSCQVCR